MSDEPFPVGTRVVKVTGDYRLPGVVVGHATTLAGKRRYVVEHVPVAPGLLHIYGASNLALDPSH